MSPEAKLRMSLTVAMNTLKSAIDHASDIRDMAQLAATAAQRIADATETAAKEHFGPLPHRLCWSCHKQLPECADVTGNFCNTFCREGYYTRHGGNRVVRA